MDRHLKCPRDAADLHTEDHRGIDVDRCHTCNGMWLDSEELDKLEATVPSTEAERRATVTYAERKGEIKCPACGKQSIVFDYRAHAVELDMCPDGHGYWLDEGEERRVREIIDERVRDLARAHGAEAGWHRFLGGLRRKR